MTIEKGKPWGEPGTLGPAGVLARSDEAVREIVETARRAGRPLPVIGLLGGDLHRTLGGVGNNEERLRTEAVTFPIDVGRVLVDGRQFWFVAHLIARTTTWSHVWGAFNAQWYEKLNLAPKAHPNDGLLDVFDAHLGWADRLKVARRARLGAHLPHPSISQTRTAATQIDWPRALHVILDGVYVGKASQITVAVDPDALRVVV